MEVGWFGDIFFLVGLSGCWIMMCILCSECVGFFKFCWGLVYVWWQEVFLVFKGVGFGVFMGLGLCFLYKVGCWFLVGGK